MKKLVLFQVPHLILDNPFLVQVTILWVIGRKSYHIIDFIYLLFVLKLNFGDLKLHN